MPSSLQDHYTKAREAGCTHAMYVIQNDLDEGTAKELEREFEQNHAPVSDEKTQEFRADLAEESRRAQVWDDLQWLLGTGRYGQ